MASMIVVGGGPAGYSAALHAALRGAEVTLIEPDTVGGTCLNRGCIPLKTLLEAGEGGHGERPAERCRAVRSALVAGVESNLKRTGVRVVRGEAAMQRDREVVVSGPEAGIFTADLVLAATGSEPCFPPALTGRPGKIVSADEFLWDPVVPASCIVVGGGPTGVEIAQALHRLGARVQVVEAAGTVLPAVDAELARVAVRCLDASGIGLFPGRGVIGADAGEQGVSVALSDGSTLDAELVIVAAGRRSRLGWADWEGLGVRRRGDFLEVDSRCRTANPGIAAAGDVAGPWRFAHTAYQQGLLAAAGLAGAPVDPPPAAIAGTPRVVYGEPEIVEAGSFPEGSRIGRFPFSVSGRAMTRGRTVGLVKAAVAADGTIAGIGIVGSGVSELADLAGFVVQNGVSAERYLTCVHPHPTLGEAVAEAIGAAVGQSVHRVRGTMR